MTQQVDTESHIKPETLELSKRIQKLAHAIDPATGESPKNTDIWAETLPDYTNAEEVKRVERAKREFFEAAGHASGQLAVPFLKKNDDRDRVTQTFSVGHDTATFTVERQASYPNPRDPGTRIVRQGALSASYTTNAASTGGQFKHIKNELAALAAEQLKIRE